MMGNNSFTSSGATLAPRVSERMTDPSVASTFIASRSGVREMPNRVRGAGFGDLVAGLEGAARKPVAQAATGNDGPTRQRMR